MRHLKLAALLFFLVSLTNCEKKVDLVNLTADANIVGFVTEKCGCCWGWVIEVGSKTIKADYIPGLDSLENVVFPIQARITIGDKTCDCSGFITGTESRPDYYEIKQCTLIK
jgi:hypothetical protein